MTPSGAPNIRECPVLAVLDMFPSTKAKIINKIMRLFGRSVQNLFE